MAGLGLPMPVLTDTYKASHFRSYPDAKRMTAYGEFRHGFQKDESDTRLVFYGLRYILQQHITRRWSKQDVEKADLFFRSHRAPDNGQFAYPKQLFLDFIEEYDGYFPLRLEALPEATVVHSRVPVFQITTRGKYSPLCTYLETLLTQVWYPSCVATASRRARDIIEAAFERSVEGGRDNPLVSSRLHDFGMRSCTCLEQTILGGTAHLLNFDGSDTMSAGYYAQFELNDGRPVASSIPATEHSNMTAWHTEEEAIRNMISQYGDGLFACVMDSFDYSKALGEVIPAIAEQKIERGGFMILRPDSGDPIEAVLQALHAAEKVFGVDVNAKGYKVPRGCGVIQGDGIDNEMLAKILDAVLAEKFSAEAVAFGMGSGLLQNINRDTMSFATKLNCITYKDGTSADIMKNPVAAGKSSFPGKLAVKRVDGVPTVFPAETGQVKEAENMLKVVYDHGPVQVEQKSFDDLRIQVHQQWTSLPATAEVVSPELEERTKRAVEKLRSKSQVATSA